MKQKVEIMSMTNEILSPITKASNVLLEDGSNVQQLIDNYVEPDFTPTIETSSSMSKVGQGDNVDFSANVINGAYESCVLKGKTLVNYNAEGNDRNEYVCMPSVEGQHITATDTIEGRSKSAILKGQTLVNLIGIANIKCQNTTSTLIKNRNSIDLTLSNASNWDNVIVSFSGMSLDKTYRVKGRITNNNCGIITFIPNNLYIGDVYVRIEPTETKEFNFSIKPKRLDELFTMRFDTETFVKGGKIVIEEFMIVESDEDIPYFEGMQSVKMPVLKTTGKNLFDMNDVKLNYAVGNINPENVNHVSSNFIKVKPLTVYYVNDSMSVVYGFDKNKNEIKNLRNSVIGGTFTTPSDCYYVRIRNYTQTTDHNSVIKSAQLEESSTATTYEPYKTNILTATSKNLFDMNRPYDTVTDSQATVTQSLDEITVSSAESGIYVNANFILDKDFFAGKTVTGSCLYESDEKDIGTVQITYQDGNGEHHYQWIKTPRTFTFPNSFIGDVMLSVSANNTGTPQSNTVTVKNIQLELGSTATPYEPYSEVVLRGIGDVKDTLDCLTGEMTQRIGEVVLDGSQSFNKYDDIEGFYTKGFYTVVPNNLLNHITNTSTIICDQIKITTFNNIQPNLGTTIDSEGLCVNGGYIKFRIDGGKASTVEELNTYLSKNPIKILIPFIEPTIKTVDLSDNHVYSYKDVTHYTCSSAEGSLIPTLSIEEGVKYQAIIKPSTKYSIVFNRTVASDSLTVDLGGATANVSSTTIGKTIVQITTLPTLSHNYVKFLGVGNVIKDVQVIEGDVADDVEYFEGMIDVENPVVTNCNMLDVDSVDYKSNTISTNEVVLRSLPNGVCDTLDLMSGEYVQRVGVRAYQEGDESNSQVSTDKVNTQYELATPITTIIDLKQHPYAYKDGYINLSSNSEKSLTPSIEYSLPINRSGQVTINTQLVQKQQKQLDELESMIIANMVNTQYKQTLSNVEYMLGGE